MSRRCLLALALAVSAGVLARAVDPPPPVLVVYTAEWCAPCQRLRRDLANHPEVLRGVPVEYRDASELGPINVRVPDIRLVQGGAVVARVVGYRGLPLFSAWLAGELPSSP